MPHGGVEPHTKDGKFYQLLASVLRRVAVFCRLSLVYLPFTALRLPLASYIVASYECLISSTRYSLSRAYCVNTCKDYFTLRYQFSAYISFRNVSLCVSKSKNYSGCRERIPIRLQHSCFKCRCAL